MSPRLMEIERKAIRLPARERELLAERLIKSAEDVPLTEIEKAWVDEAERRFAAYRRGERKGIPAARAIRKIREEMGWQN